MFPFSHLPRTLLTHLPTPIEPLSGLSKHMGGPSILVKRDDLTSLAMGGNKTRKLEFLLADAVEQGADTVITSGGSQSNHCRLTAAAATRLGLKCELVFGGEQRVDMPNGNLFLDQLFGATVHWSEPELRNETVKKVAISLRTKGRTPYVIPIGGSNGIGAVGYVAAMFEFQEQLASTGQEVDHIIFATSSGGTHVGLQLGARLTGFQGQILGLSIDQTKTGEFPPKLADVANETAERLQVNEQFEPDDFTMNTDYLGSGYGVVGDLERETITLAARCDGLLVGPVYTGRALGGLIDLIRRGTFHQDETVLFWHTGGVPALFAYVNEVSV